MVEYNQIISATLIVTWATNVFCAPAASRSWADDKIIFSKNDVGRPDGYEFGYETAFGNKRYEVGTFKEYAKGKKQLEITGEYQYLNADGTPRTVRYVVNEEGYRELVIPNAKVHSLQKQLEEHKTLSRKLPSNRRIADKELVGHVFPLNVINYAKKSETGGAATTPKYDLLDPDSMLPFDYEYEEDIGNRVGLPAIVIGSLLG